MSDTALQSMRNMLDGREAFRVGYNINPATGVETLSRAWWVKYDQYQESAKHLDSYADAENDDPTDYISTPYAGRADSFPGKWVHSGCSQNEDADKLIQALTRVYDITTNDELFARDKIPTFDNEILNLFGLAESEGDSVAIVIHALSRESRAFCMAIDDDELITGVAGATWTYAGRRFEVDPNTNSARLIVAGQMKQHNAFDNTAPDLTWYSYRYTKQEQKHQSWILIDNSDPLTGLYTPDSGYNVTTVSISRGQLGSLSIQRNQLIEARGSAASPYEEDRQQTINPHGFTPGTMNTIMVKNHHLKDPTVYYGTPSSTTGYVLVDIDKSEEGNGLWSKVYTYQKPTWTEWDSDVEADNVTYAGLGKNNESFTRIWEGIKIEDKDTAVDAIKLGAGTEANVVTGFRIDSAYARDNGNGSITVYQTQRKDNTGGSSPRGSRLDYDGIILKHREQVSARTSGGIDIRRLVVKSMYGQLFTKEEETTERKAAERAWDWAMDNEAGGPTGSPHDADPVTIFDDSTGVEIGSIDGYVQYAGDGVWEAVRICYEEDNATEVPIP